MRSRRSEARKADQIIEEGVHCYLEERRSLQAVDVVKEYRQMAEQFREQELQRALRALSRGEDPSQLLAQMARGLTNKLIHAPTTGLKQASAEGRQDLLGSARKLLGLEQAVLEQSAQQAPEPAEPESDDFDPPPTPTPTNRRTLQ